MKTSISPLVAALSRSSRMVDAGRGAAVRVLFGGLAASALFAFGVALRARLQKPRWILERRFRLRRRFFRRRWKLWRRRIVRRMVMALKSERFFTTDEKSAIDRTIKDVEKKTSGEIVVMVVDSSDRYEDIDAVLALICGATLSVVPADLVFIRSAHFLPRFLPSLHWTAVVPDNARFITALLFFITMSIVLYFPIRYFVSFFPFIKSLFLSDRRREREIRERAVRAFHQQGLHNTRDETGILFLISLLERKVYVLADKGIYLSCGKASYLRAR